MTSYKVAWCSGRDAMGVIFFIISGIYAAASLVTSEGAGPRTVQSQTCYGTANCSLHRLDCGAGQRLAILEAAYGFQPAGVHQACQAAGIDTCPEPCCSYNESADCKHDFSAGNMALVQTDCSFNTSCQTRSQRGDNTACSPLSDRALTSSYSVLTALCVPEVATVDPCSNTTVSGNLVSLIHQHASSSSSASSCYCRIDVTNNSINGTNTNASGDIVQVTAYDVQGSLTSSWKVEVREGGGGTVLTLADWVKVFPAATFRTPLSSLPLSVLFDFSSDVAAGGSTTPPARVWLGFQVASSSLVMRCGEQANAYEMSISTPLPAITSTGSNTSLNPPATEKPGEEQKQGTTDIIVYAAVGVASLIASAFLYVCAKKIRRKGCPGWCPQACQDLECGKADNNNTTNNNNANASTATINNVPNGSTIASVAANGVIIPDIDWLIANGASSAFTQRKCSFELNKRHRGSLLSLRRPSFGDLENITESDEEGKFPTHHNHSQLNLQEQEEIFKKVDSRLAGLTTELTEEDVSVEDKDGDGSRRKSEKKRKERVRNDSESDDDVFSKHNGGVKTSNYLDVNANANSAGVVNQNVRSRVGKADANGDAKPARDGGQDNKAYIAEGQEGKGEGEDWDNYDRPSVVFHLGGSTSSDPDLENLTKL